MTTLKITKDDLKTLAPTGAAAILQTLPAALNTYLPQYGIDTPLRVVHFLAQAAHESDGFRTLTEYASGKAYEGRKDLGNVVAGDGVRFKGRGIFQLTGRANYKAYGRKIGLDLIKEPTLASNPEVSVRIACEYWKAKGLNAWADRDDVVEITRRINGGRNGLSQRRTYLAKAKKIDFFDGAAALGLMLVAPVTDPEEPDEEVPDAPIAAMPDRPLWRSTEIMTTVSTAAAGLLGALQSPWAVAGMLGLVIIAGAAYLIWKRTQRTAPV